MQLQISILTDNTATYGYLAEWGLSVLIKTGNFCVLMDTGFTGTATFNSRTMGIDLASLDAIVLSHGHVDHTGGLRDVLLRSGAKPVLCHPAALEPKVRRAKNSPDRRIGMPLTREELESIGARLNLARGPVELAAGVFAGGEVPMKTGFEAIDEGLYHEADNAVVPDPMLDDLSLAFKTERGLVIVLGCAHRGPVNVIRHFQNLTGEESVYALIGGMHLMHASEERLSETVRSLKATGVKKLFLGHCTGFHALARLANEFGDALVPIGSGTVHTIP